MATTWNSNTGCSVISAALLLVTILCCCSSVNAMRFDMESTDTKCFSEELTAKGLVVSSYRVVSENPHNISARVSSPYGNVMHHLDNVKEGRFSFTADEVGSYLACFWMANPPRDAKISVELEWRTGVAAKDWDSIAKREKLEGMELELRKLEDTVGQILDEMKYLRSREEEMRNVNELTNTRLGWFSVSSLFVCLLVAGLQLWHLKTFFEKKKLI